MDLKKDRCVHHREARLHHDATPMASAFCQHPLAQAVGIAEGRELAE